MAVLIKGKSIAGSQKSRDHYLRGPENEHIKVLEIKGFATTNPDEALKMIELSAKGTKCENPLYSAKINPETDRRWALEEVFHAADLLENNLNLTGHQRILVEHEKEGRIHYHALWNRFPPEGGPAVHMSHDYEAHQLTQRQLEKEFKLKPLMAKGRDFKDSEVKWAQRLGFDIFALREQITADFNKAKSGQEFISELEKQGIVLCKGDKIQFVLILPWGQHKALSSMIHGRPTKAILRRALGDIDIANLPTVDEGKAIVKARLPKGQPKAYRRVGQTYTKRNLFPIVAWKTNKLSFAARQIRPLSVLAMPTILELKSKYQPAPQNPKPIRESFAEEKHNLFYPLSFDADEPPSFADIAYEEEFKKWNGLIDAAAKDKSVPKEQRRANVAALRQQQRHAAQAVRKRIREEERATVHAWRCAKRILLVLPP